MLNLTSRRVTALAIAAAGFTAAACSPSGSSTGADASGASATPGTGGTAIGFIMVGPRDDYGYNQAVYEASQVVAEQNPDLEVLTAENVPEDDSAATTMQQMIDRGANIIFATSYGHLDAAETVAEENPGVVVVQQGNTLAADAILPNSGTYFGTVYEPMYLAGIAAGAATQTGRLGYVYAFPIPQTVANINAFERGAQTVRPDVETVTVATSSWCDPAAQRDAATSLLGQDVDVLTQHQDCTSTVIDAAEAAGAYSVGYHADASSLAPRGWLTGAVWDWAPLYSSIVETALAGEFTGSEYNANYRVGFQTGTNPFELAPFGPSVTPETVAAIEAAQARLSEPGGSPFTGPVLDQAGAEVVPAGSAPTYEEVDSMDYFVDGVVGNLE